MKTRANNDLLTMGMGQKPFKNRCMTVGRAVAAAAGLLGTALALPAWAQAGGGGAAAAVRASASAPVAGASTPAGPSASASASAPAPAQPRAPRWGEGVLEREFLVQLRRFLETDPFDMKVLSELAGQIEIDPKDGPRADGTWGARSVKVRWPLGASFGNRSGGGAQFAYAHDRSGSYLHMEFVKMPPAGKRDGDGLPCLTPEMLKEVFSTGWVGTTTYTDFSPAYPGRLPYPIPSNQIFRWQPDTLEQVRLVYQLNEICVPGLTVGFKKLPPHPASRP